MYNFLVSLLKKTIHIYIVLYINQAFSFFVYGALKNCSDIDDEDEFATNFIYNNGNNASTDNITA